MIIKGSENPFREEPIGSRENFPQLTGKQRAIFNEKIQTIADLATQKHGSIRDGEGETEYNKEVAKLLNLNLGGYSEIEINMIAPLTWGLSCMIDKYRLSSRLTALEHAIRISLMEIGTLGPEADLKIQTLEEQVKEAIRRKAAELDQAEVATPKTTDTGSQS